MIAFFLGGRWREVWRRKWRDPARSGAFFQIIHFFARKHFLHTPSFVGMNYTDGLIVLELTFISGRPKETRLALLEALNEAVVANAGISPDDLPIVLYEVPGENVSRFGATGIRSAGKLSAAS